MAKYARRRFRPPPVVSNDERARRDLSLEADCPYCDVPAHEPCVTRSDKARDVPHAVRMRGVTEEDVAARLAEQESANAARRRDNRLIGWGVVLVVLVGAAAFSLHDSAADPEWLVAPTSPSVESTLAGWEPLRCADGWTSTSIGKQGACSHHGGVVGGPVYETKLVPGVEAVLAPERIDWGLVAGRGFWSLLLGGAGGGWLWRRIVEARH